MNCGNAPIEPLDELVPHDAHLSTVAIAQLRKQLADAEEDLQRPTSDRQSFDYVSAGVGA